MDNRYTREKTYRHTSTVLLGALFVSVYFFYFSMPANSQPQYQRQEKQQQRDSQGPQGQRSALQALRACDKCMPTIWLKTSW